MTAPHPPILKRVPTPGFVRRGDGPIPCEVWLGFGPEPAAIAVFRDARPVPEEHRRTDWLKRYPSLDALLLDAQNIDPLASEEQLKMLRDAHQEARAIRPNRPWHYITDHREFFRTLTVVRLRDGAGTLALTVRTGTPFVVQHDLGFVDFDGTKLEEPHAVTFEMVTAPRIEGLEAVTLAEKHKLPLWSTATDLALTPDEAHDFVHSVLGHGFSGPITDEQKAALDRLVYLDIDDLVHVFEQGGIEVLRWTGPS